jgi:hypothetical protein
MNRYTRIAELMEEALGRKTGWGRNEVMVALREVLNRVADEEITELTSKLAAPSVDPHSVPELSEAAAAYWRMKLAEDR